MLGVRASLVWSRRSSLVVGIARCGVAFALLAASPTTADYVNLEAAHVRPLALSPDGSQLFAVNTPDNRLSIFDVTAGGLALAVEVPVGMRPVAVAVREGVGGTLEAWVVNHLSDSVSIVTVDSAEVSLSRVTKTLLVGDEPRDIVFGGTGGEYAFIATARRGQHQNVPSAALSTPGTPRALVWVFDVSSTGAGIGGTPVNVIALFADTPRALAVSGDGSTVYASAFRSGNGTTVIAEAAVAAGGGVPPMPPGATAGWPDTGLIVKHDPSSGRWEDETGADWSSDVPFSLPDLDVFVIDATASPPVLQAPPNSVARVGTVLFNMAVRPGSGKLYVSNVELRNQVRFVEMVGPTVGLQGHFAENRITVVAGTTAAAIHLNSHVDYGVPTGSQAEIDQSLGLPLDMVFDGTGDTLYVAAFGSSKVAVLDADSLEAGSVGTDRIDVPGGPSGLALDESLDRLYVMSRFEHKLTVIEQPGDSLNRAVLAVVDLADPEPAEATDGRKFLYDTAFSSGHGDVACGTCHLFGDMDKMSWDLGAPYGAITPNPNPMIPQVGGSTSFHPLKGPMTTQSLRGLPGQGPLHWRGDQTNVGDPMDVPTDFGGFSAAFVGLMGRASEPAAADFAAFTDFVMTLRYPPNPNRSLDDVPTAAQAAGENTYVNATTAVIFKCNDCHALPTGTNGLSLDEVAVGIGTQVMKTPHLRNMYDKVGAYTAAGDQVSAFGFIHDGSAYSMADFLSVPIFSLTAADEANVEAFLMALDTGLKPAVGEQVCVNASNYADSAVFTRVALLQGQADLGDCDLIAKGVYGGEARGAVHVGSGNFQTDRADDPVTTTTALLMLAGTPGQEEVFTCVPPGTGQRMGIDRDEDTYFDRDELDAGSDPADPLSIPGGTTATLVAGKKLLIKNKLPDDESRNKIVILARDTSITTPAPGSPNDPRCNGDPSGTVKASLAVSSLMSGESHSTELPCQNWKVIGSDANPKGFKYKDRELDDGTAKVILWKDGSKLRAVLKGNGPSALDYDLQLGVPQGTVAAVFSSGNTFVCMTCPDYKGKDGSDGKKFFGKDCAAPASCPGL